MLLERRRCIRKLVLSTPATPTPSTTTQCCSTAASSSRRCVYLILVVAAASIRCCGTATISAVSKGSKVASICCSPDDATGAIWFKTDWGSTQRETAALLLYTQSLNKPTHSEGRCSTLLLAPTNPVSITSLRVAHQGSSSPYGCHTAPTSHPCRMPATIEPVAVSGLLY